MNKRKVGTAYEQQACTYLKSQGYEILATNFRCRFGEIDIIARDGGYLCFVEVKYRRKKQTGYPEEAVDYRKQYKICRVADYYMISRRNSPTGNVRFDVVAILGDAIHLYRNAFAYIVQ